MISDLIVQPLGPLLGERDEVFLSFQECPFDVVPPDHKDGDDSVHAQEDHALSVASSRMAAAAHVPEANDWPLLAARPSRAIVPHPRDLKRGSRGADVFALQRALAAAHYRKWGSFSAAFGVGVLDEVKKFQHDHSIRATGVYGEATHRALAPFYDAYGVAVLTQFAARTTVEKRQKTLLAAATVSYNYRDLLHYTQGPLRWYLIANHVLHSAIPALHAGYGDCSAYATWLYWDCGAPDPNELDYTGGYTGTLGIHGKVIEPAKAKTGALFLYGPGTHHHVQVSVGGTATIGFGSESGPNYWPADYRGDLDVVRAYPGLS